MTRIDTSFTCELPTPRCTERMFNRHAVDGRLVAAVQTNAGARCHEAANLLNCYGLASQAYAMSVFREDRDAAATELKVIEESECALRRFLFQCRVRH